MLIGLTGCKGSGKDTVGQHLVNEYGFHRLAFADKLKQAVANLFGITVEEVDRLKNKPSHVRLTEVGSDSRYSTTAQLIYWREFLQRFGTEMGRNTFGQDFWTDLWETTYHEAQMTSSAYKPVVVTDVRFENEARRIIQLGGWLIEVVRPGHEPDGHASEEPIDRDLLTAQLGNDGSIEDLYEMTDGLMEVLRAR